MIKIDDNFYLEIDTYNVVLYYKKINPDKINKKTNKPIISSDKWFYPSIDRALIGYLKNSNNFKDATCLKDILEKLEDLEIFIKKEILNIKNKTLNESLRTSNETQDT